MTAEALPSVGLRGQPTFTEIRLESCWTPVSDRSRGAVRRRSELALLALVLGLGPPSSPLAAGSFSTEQEVQRLTGRIHVVWDSDPRRDAGGRRFFLVEPEGRSVEIMPGSDDIMEALQALDRRIAAVSGTLRSTATPTGTPALMVGQVRAGQGGQAAEGPLSAASVDRRDFVTILCRFADDPEEPFTRPAVETVHGSSYPGMRQYYAEVSRDPGVMAGSTVVGWYLLPSPRSAYVDDTASSTDVARLAQDCAGAADADVDFTGFYGINVQVSGFLSKRTVPPYDPLSFGGSFTLSLDGASRTYGMTWLSGEHHDNYVVVTHEMGHALGWPHSSGRYGSEYDSRWDVMSVGYFRTEAPWGWLTIHTIAHHKRLAGWIPDARLWRPADGVTETATIVRSALPPDEGYLMADIPTGPGRSLTVEARLVAGHDHPLPAEAVVIHETVGARAYVVDPDNDGDPNDEGAIWLPGETFTDSINGVSVAVEERVSDGFRVTISRLSEDVCTVTASADPVDAGSVTVLSGGQTGSCGRTVTVGAAPNVGWTFTYWSVDSVAVSTNVQYDIQVSSDLDLVAHFERTCTVQAVAAPAVGGSATVTSGGEAGPCGRSVTVSAQANAGWEFIDWTEAGLQIGTTRSFSLEPSGDRLLTATFVDAADLGSRALEALFGVAGRLDPPEISALDRDGNQNGSFDVGDLLAFYDRHPGPSAGASR